MPKDRSRDKYRRAMRDLGRPSMVGGEDAQRAFTKIRELNSQGMSCTQMARQLDLSQSTISQMLNGYRLASREGRAVTQLWRTTYDKIMRLQFEDPRARGGARLPSIGARRRLQALTAVGFTADSLCRHLPFWTKAGVNRFLVGETAVNFVFAHTHQHICLVYDKLSYVDPKDLGLTNYAIGRAKAAAKRHTWAPTGCWDTDTIDDPDAIPEWTGACGTAEGYRIHKREGHVFAIHGAHTTFACDPCRKAFAEYRTQEKVAAGSKIQAARLLGEGKTLEEITDLLGVHPRTVERARKMLDGDPEELEEA